MNSLNKTSKNSTNSGRQQNYGMVYLKLVGCVIVMVLTTIGNLLVCLSVLIYKKLQTRSNVILFSLAVSDLLMILSMVFNTLMVQRGEWPFSRQLCTIVSSLSLNLCFISILHLCLLSIDRYISIKKPFRHYQLMTCRRIRIFLVFIWVVPSVLINLPFADFDFRASVFGCVKNTRDKHDYPASSFILVLLFVIIPFSAIFYVYIYLFKVVRQHARRIIATEMQLSSQVEAANHNRPHGLRALMKKEVKSIKTFALVIGAFVLCYTPFFLLGTYQSSRGPGTVSSQVLSAVTWLAFCNSFVNPVVYSLRYKEFRMSFWNIVCSLCSISPRRATIETKITTAVGTNVQRRPSVFI